MKNNANSQHPSPYRAALSADYKSSINQGIHSMLTKMTDDRPYFWRYLFIILFVVAMDLLENVVSAYTSYHYIFNLTAGFTSSAKWLSVTFLILFEGAKLIIYFKMAIALFDTKEGIPWGLICSAAALTAGSIWFSYNGAHDVVYTRTAPPVMATMDESEQILKENIASRRATIKNIEGRSEKSIKAVVNRQVTNLEKLIAADTDKLTSLAIARKSGDKEMMFQHGQTNVITTEKVRNFTILLNLLSLLIFSPLLGNFIIKSQLDYSIRLGEITPETSQNIVRSVPKNGKPKADIKRENKNGNGGSMRPAGGIPVALKN